MRRFWKTGEFRPWSAGPALEITFGTMMKLTSLKPKSLPSLTDVKGRVLPPLLLYILGVPGGICLLLWVFFFRGK